MPAVALPPPTPPAIHAPAPARSCQLSDAEAQQAFDRLRRRLPSTGFIEARPSEVCGLVWLRMARGTIAYTDRSGRYLLLALALDTNKGSPADVAETLDRVIEDRESGPPGRTDKDSE